MPASNAKTVAELVVDFLVARSVDRVFGLQGGHIQPIWDQLAQRGVRIVDVRDEGAAVHMAHAHAVLTGQLGVAMVTAGPGVTNCVTAMANAQLERVPVLLIGGCAPRRAGRSRPAARHRARRHPAARHAPVAHAARGRQRAARSGQGVGRGRGRRQSAGSGLRRDPHRRAARDGRAEARAARVSRAASRRGASRPTPPTSSAPRAYRARRSARWSSPAAARWARARSSCASSTRPARVYLDTQESRGLVPADHPSVVGAMRGRAMQEADLVIVVGRKLDYQTGYGSPAVFPHARFIRIADCWEELRENRRGEVELFASPALALAALATRSRTQPLALDAAWTEALRERAPAARGDATPRRSPTPPAGKDGHMHPNRIFAALPKSSQPDAITIADGGDILSFARLGLATPRPTSTPAPSAAWASAFRTASPPPCCIPTGRWWWSRATAPSASTPWRSTPPSATAPRPSSSSPTTPPGTSSASTRR